MKKDLMYWDLSKLEGVYLVTGTVILFEDGTSINNYTSKKLKHE